MAPIPDEAVPASDTAPSNETENLEAPMVSKDADMHEIQVSSAAQDELWRKRQEILQADVQSQ